MNRDEYDFESELAQSISAIVNDEAGNNKKYHSGTRSDDTIIFEDLDDDFDNFEYERVSKEQPKKKRENVSRKSVKKKKKNSNAGLIIGIILVIAAVIIAVFLILYTAQQNARKNTYSYNFNMAVDEYSDGDYADAKSYFSKALTYYDEADQINIRFYLYQCEKMLGNEEKGIEWLTELLNYDNYNSRALSLISDYYYNSNNTEKLNEMILKYKDTAGESAFSKYVNAKPGVSHGSGSYGTSIEVTLFCGTGNDIYYTLDGTIPNEKDSLYTEPIKISKGTTTLKAVSIGDNGIVSDILECKYVVTYAVPDKPVVTPGSGSYNDDQLIVIENFVDDGSFTAYYTLDGSVPTDESAVYTGPIDMPNGNNVFSVVFISKDGISTNVVKRNYNLKLSAKFSFDEALTMLKEKMIEKGDLAESGDATVVGESVRFVYYKKQSVDDREMYLVYYDVKIGSGYVRQDYLYGIDVVTGKYYKITDADGTLKADEYK